MLLVDGHSSHVSIEFIDYACGNRIILVCLPSHTTHLLQPLDVGLFRPLQQYYSQLIDERSRNGLSYIDKTEFLRAFHFARQKAYTQKNISSAFKKTGIIPHDPDQVLNQLPQIVDHPSKPPGTPPPSKKGSVAVKTPRHSREVDDILDALFDRVDLSPGVVKHYEKLAKGLKGAIAMNQLLLHRNEQLLAVAAARKTRTRRMNTKDGGLLTLEMAENIKQERLAKDIIDRKKKRHREEHNAYRKMLRDRATAAGRKTTYRSKLIILTVDTSKNPDGDKDIREEFNLDEDEDIIREDLDM